MLKLISQPQKLLATILIANNLVNVTIVVAHQLCSRSRFCRHGSGSQFRVADGSALLFLILLFGEILPKLYANNYPVKWARFAAPAVVCMESIVASVESAGKKRFVRE